MDFEAKAKELEGQMKRDRDQEIEHIISRFSEENEDLEAKAFEKYKRKLEELGVAKGNEAAGLARRVKVLEGQLEGLKRSFGELEEEKRRGESELLGVVEGMKEKDRELRETMTELGKLRSQTAISDEIISGLERNFAARIEKERQEQAERLAELRRAGEEEKAQHYKELDALAEKQARELESMEERVRRAIARKEAEIARLGEELRQKTLEIEKYKELLERQRRDLMKP